MNRGREFPSCDRSVANVRRDRCLTQAGRPYAHDPFNDAYVPTCGFDPGRFDLPTTYLDEQEYRQTHCDSCGGVTAGTIVAGVHHQQCNECLRVALWETPAELEEGRAA